MHSIAFALPVAAGKKGADVRRFVSMLLVEKSSHFKARMQSRGYKRLKIFHQEWPSEHFVIYAEAEDMHETLKGKKEDTEFESWFLQQYEALLGHHPSKVAPHISELVMDWHHEKGGSHTHHH